MSQTFSPTETLNYYFLNANADLTSKDIQLEQICYALAQAKKTLSNEKITLGLIKKLETENDLASADFYRQALELILKIPDL